MSRLQGPSTSLQEGEPVGPKVGPTAVIFGAGGLLGQTLATALPAAGYRIVAAPRGRAEGDIADAAAVEAIFAAHRPQVVFNAAAYTDVDGAEAHPTEAMRANAEGPGILAALCARTAARLVHYSTDFVFDGERETPYDESVPPSPQGQYARSKVAGEQRVQAADPRAAILRVGCLYGPGGRNFPSTLLRRLRAGETIRADNERRVAPTWVIEVARLSAAIGVREAAGIFHATASGETTWADYARFLIETTGLPRAHVEAVAGSALRLPAPRPRRAILVSRRLAEVGLAPLPPWPDQAHAYLASEGVGPA